MVSVFALAIASAAFFTAAIVGAGLAKAVARIPGNWVKYANAICGGVLLSVAIVHMLSESAAELEDVGKTLNRALGGEGEEPFPVGYLLSGIGFLSIVAIERLLVGHHDHEASTQDITSPRVVVEKVVAELPPRDVGGDEINSHAEDPKLAAIDLEANCTGKLRTMDVFGGDELRKQMREVDHLSEEATLSPDDKHRTKCRLVGMATWCGITVHSSIEAVVTGGSRDEASLLMLMSAVLAHKVLTSFAIGVALRYVSTRAWLMLVVAFALTGPIGILIGASCVSNLEGEQSAALQCLASGTLLAIGIDSMLLPSLEEKSYGAFACAVVAYLAMSTLAAWA